MRQYFYYFSLVLGLVFGMMMFTACGGGDDEDGPQTGEVPPPSTTGPETPPSTSGEETPTSAFYTDKGYFDGLLYYKKSSNETPEVAVVGAENTIATATIPKYIKIDDMVYTVTSIYEKAFNNYTSLTSITIPNSVTSISEWAFAGSSLKSVTIPNSVTTLGEYVFAYCDALVSVTIGSGVTSIPDCAFHYSHITSVTIGNNVRTIGEYAFQGCGKLTSVTIPNSVTSIGYYAFSYCKSLKSVTIGNSVKTIESRTFEGCTSIKDVYCYAPNVPTTDSDAFFYGGSYTVSPIISNATLHVPSASIGSYRSTYPWSGFGSIVAL